MPKCGDCLGKFLHRARAVGAPVFLRVPAREESNFEWAHGSGRLPLPTVAVDLRATEPDASMRSYSSLICLTFSRGVIHRCTS